MLLQLLHRKLLVHSMWLQLEHSKLAQRLHRKLLVHSMKLQQLDHSHYHHCHNQLEHSSWLLQVHSRLAQRCIRNHDCS